MFSFFPAPFFYVHFRSDSRVLLQKLLIPGEGFLSLLAGEHLSEFPGFGFVLIGSGNGKETGQQIRQAAAEAGQSVQQYILQAVADRMDKGK